MSPFVKKIFNYVSGATFNKLLLVLLLPLFTRKMLPPEYAVYGNISIFISFFTLIYYLGLPQALYPWYNQQKDEQYKKNLIITVFTSLIGSALIFSVLIVMSRNYVTQIILKDSSYADLLILVIGILSFDVIYGATLTLLNIMEKSLSYAVLGAIKNLIFLILISAGYLFDLFSIKHIVLFMFAASGISCLTALIYLNKRILPELGNTVKGMFSFNLLKELLRFGLPMILGSIAFLILRISDRYMLTWLSPGGMYDVGIYTVGYRMGMMMSFVTSLMSIIYYPYAMRISEESFAAKNYRKVHKYYLIIGGLFAGLILLFIQEIFSLFIGNQYGEAIPIVIYGVVSVFLLGAFHLVNIPFYTSKRSNAIALIVALGALLNLGLNYLFIPKYGIEAAGAASVLSYLVIYLLIAIGSAKISNVKFNVFPVFIIIPFLFILNIINTLELSIYFLFGKIVIMIVMIFIMFKNKKIRQLLIQIKNK